MIVKRLEAGSPAVIPAELLAELGLKPGDDIAIDIVGDKIVVAPAKEWPDMFVGNFSTFTEWDSEADREAFADDEEIVQEAIDRYLKRSPAPTHSIEDVEARLHTHMEALARKRDAA